MVEKAAFVLGIGVFASILLFSLSISLLATTDFGEQKRSRDIAISMVVITGLPFAGIVIGGVAMCCGLFGGFFQVKTYAG